MFNRKPRNPYRNQVIRVKDLPSSTHACLYCTKCHDTYSAYRGDYFLADPNHIIRCCNQPVIAVVKKTTYQEIEL